MNKKLISALLAFGTLSVTMSNANENRNKSESNWEIVSNDFYNEYMKNLNDNVKYGDIVQINAHDALATQGNMTTSNNSIALAFSRVFQTYSERTLDSLAACQYHSPAKLAGVGVTCFDIRVVNVGNNDWRGVHGPVTSNKNAVKEVAELVRVIKNNPETIYTIKFRGDEKFLYELSSKLKNDYGINLENLIFTPADGKGKSLNGITLGEARKLQKNLVIIDSEQKQPTKSYSSKWKNKIWRETFVSSFSSEQQVQTSGQDLVDLCIRKITEMKRNGNNNKTFGMTPAPTLGIKGIIKMTSYYSPLNGAKNMNEGIISASVKNLKKYNSGFVQHVGLNGITLEQRQNGEWFSPEVEALFKINERLKNKTRKNETNKKSIDSSWVDLGNESRYEISEKKATKSHNTSSGWWATKF
jgi:hypothetical protein